MNKTALLVVDLQNDFCPNGALAVSEGDKIIPVVNNFIFIAMGNKMPIFASRDWHPQNHCSFKEQGGPWPAHCVQSTVGAEFHPDLKLPKNFILISKGTEEDRDSYSAFGGKNLEGKALLEILTNMEIKKLWICGLATDYCVRATALDAQNNGFEVTLIENACAAVNVNPNDGEKAIAEMKQNKIQTMNLIGHTETEEK